MAAFSYQNHNPFGALDAAYLPSASFDLPLLPPTQQQQQLGDMSPSDSPCFPLYYHQPHHTIIPEISTTDVRITTTHESSISLESGRVVVPSGDNRMVSSYSSSSGQRSEVVSKTPSPMEKMARKDRQRRSSNEEAKEGKSCRKQKKCKGGVKEVEEKKIPQDSQAGYIHVRARRGQATDSHSLAERVRREKISERMKMLQGLVPGCDKVIGKALMLDEIINYVQSLQNQVEFLSMKLASANPMLYDFGLDSDHDYMVQPEKLESMSPPLSSVQQTSLIQPTAFADTANNYPMLDTSVPFLLHGQGPTAFPQDNNSSFAMQVGDHRQRFLSQVEFNNMCSSFQ